MPVINMDLEDLERLVGDGFDLREFEESIPMIGASVERVNDSEISVEFDPDRPDLFSVEGVARAYGRFKDLKREDLSRPMRISGKSGIEMSVDPGLKEIRPVIGGAFLEGVEIGEHALVSIMNLQEKLHVTVGRKRRKVAIGIHDAAPLRPPFRYWAADPEEVDFVALQKTEEWNLEKILTEHEKGIEYAWTLEGMDRYPVITDSKDQVLSFPPIINGELTRVTEDTSDIFVDCTGWDLRAVRLAVNIVCSQLMDRGGVLKSVHIAQPEEFKSMGITTRDWPVFDWAEAAIDIEWARSWLGKGMDGQEMKDGLRKMGYERPSVNGNLLKCLIPPWRGDILHQADIAEDLAIGYGFDNFEGVGAKYHTTGGERPINTLSDKIRDILVGLGFLEVRTLSLSNEHEQFALMKRKEFEHTSIVNPINTEHTMIRVSGIPSLISLLRANKHRELPQRLFEISDCMIGHTCRTLISAVSEDPKASFTEIKGVVERLLSDLSIDHDYSPDNLGCYIRGRGAAVRPYGKKGTQDAVDVPFPELQKRGENVLGHIGELDPSIISEMELVTPVSSFELDLDIVLESVGTNR